MLRITLAAALAALMLVSGCTGVSGPSSSSAGASGITMYGTIDEGVTVRK